MKVFIEDIIEDGELKGKLFLESDEQQFIIKEYTGKIDDKGNERYKNHGYFPNVASALKHILKLKVMASTATTLAELRQDIENIRAYIESSLSMDL